MKSDGTNSFWLAVQYLSTLLISFITIKLNMMHFGNELFGMWIALTSLWTMGTALDLGFGLAVIKHISGSRRNNNIEETNAIVTNAFIVFIIIGLIVLLGGIYLSFILYYLNEDFVSIKNRDIAIWLVPIMGINFLFQYLSIFFRSVFEGLNYFSISSILGIIYNLMIFLAVMFVTIFDLSLIELTLMYSFSSCITLITFIIILRKRFQEIKIKHHLLSMSEIKRMFSFSIHIQISSIFSALFDPIIKYILGSYSSLSIITFYEIARKFAISVSGLFYASFRTFIPKSSVLVSKTEYEQYILKEGVKLSNYGILYSGIVFGILSIIIISIIQLWFGYEEIILLYLILAIPEALNTMGYSIYIFLLGIGKAFLLAIIQLINLSFVVIMLLISYHYYDSYSGLFGLTLSVILSFILMIVYCKRILGLQVVDYLKRIYLFRINALIILMLVSYLSVKYSDFNLYVVISIISLFSMILNFRLIRNYGIEIFLLFKDKIGNKNL
ncbi:MAG TPA: oligosaccharide flippase family protein [Ignavibacteriaceae bacterium]|nr:oligosaccharide flippase family protein [Ignavibacteriaceae bacterium]